MSQFRNRALATASLLALATALPAQAQTQTAQTEAVDEIVVTGTRVVRDGYQAPTPLTVMDAEQIRAAAPANVADFVNELPALAGPPQARPQLAQEALLAQRGDPPEHAQRHVRGAGPRHGRPAHVVDRRALRERGTARADT